MTPLAYLLIAVAFSLGFFIGRRRGVEVANPMRDREVARAMSAKGHEVTEDKIKKRKERILDKVYAVGRITNDDVEDMFCISDNTARNYLNELEHDGKLKQIGETGAGVHYVPR